jgi:hypothetical protein
LDYSIELDAFSAQKEKMLFYFYKGDTAFNFTNTIQSLLELLLEARSIPPFKNHIAFLYIIWGKDMHGLPADSLKRDPYSFDSQFASLYYIKQHCSKCSFNSQFASLYYIKQHCSKCQGETSAWSWWNTNVHAPTSIAGSGAWPTSLL